MNNSKKLRPKKVKEVKLSEKPITSISKPWLIASLVLVVVLIAALLFDQFYSPTLMKIDGKSYSLKDVSYYIYTAEASYDYYDKMLGGSYWDMVVDEKTGTTMRDQAKQNTLNEILKTEVLYKEAIKNNYKLTGEEKDTVNSTVTSLLSGKMTKEVIQKNKFTKAYLTKNLNKVTLAQRYKADVIDKLNIDDQKIKDGISFDENRQYNIEYIYSPTQVTDSDGKTTDFTKDEKAEALNKINAAYDTAKTAEDWDTLVKSEYPELTYKASSFVVNDKTFSADFEAMMEKMENNQVSEVYEDTTGYYIVRMKDNKSTEAYDKAVKTAISKEEESQFADYFLKNILPKHKYSLKDKAIKSLKMGHITL